MAVAVRARVEKAAAVPAADGAAPAGGPRAGPLGVRHVLDEAVLAEALAAGGLAARHRSEALRLVPWARGVSQGGVIKGFRKGVS